MKSIEKAIRGKSWYDAKRIARLMMRSQIQANPWKKESITREVANVLISYHATMYGLGLCDTDEIFRFLSKQ